MFNNFSGNNHAVNGGLTGSYRGFEEIRYTLNLFYIDFILYIVIVYKPWIWVHGVCEIHIDIYVTVG